MRQDLRFAARMLFLQRRFATVALFTLAVGIGAATAIFSVVDALLLRALPFSDADRLVYLREVTAAGSAAGVAAPNFEDIETQSRSFAALGYVGGGNLVVTGGTEAVRTRVSYASQHILDVLGVQPIAGRAFLPEETTYPGPAAVLVSYGFWQRLLGGRPDFDTMRLHVDGVSCAVVGVMPSGFSFPSETEVWIANNVEPPNTSRSGYRLPPVIGRLRPGVSIDQARAEVSAIAKALRETHGAAMDAVDITLVPAQEYLTRTARTSLWLFAGAVAMLLLVACANVSNLRLAQYVTRQREFTVRAALGARRWRLARQLTIENLLLTLPATAIAALLARVGVRLILALDQGTLPRLNVIGIDARVLLFACSLAVLIAVGLGVLPALRLGRQDLSTGLRESAPGLTSGRRLRGMLVVVQVSLTIVLLTAAGLLGRSFVKLAAVDPGFKTDDTVAMTLALPSTISVAEDDALRQFYVDLVDRLERLPDVDAAGGIASLPLAGAGASGTFLIDANPQRTGEAGYAPASAGYFAAMRIPLLRGRMFDRRDTVNSPHVAVISQSLVERYWPNDDPIGKRIQFRGMDGDRRRLEVVGVVGDVRTALDAELRPMVYAYSVQRPQWWQAANLSIVVRARHEPETLIRSMRAAVQALRPDVPVRFQTLDQIFFTSLGQRRFILSLFGVFAGVALIVAGVGLYGVMACTVAQRTREIGIRMALGAQPGSMIRLMIGHGMTLTVTGVVVGLTGALAATRLMRSLLVGVAPTDPLTFAAIALLLIAVALVACLIPTRRAANVDPLAVLRSE